MKYRITAYTKRQARKLGVTVKPSTVKGKKIDVDNKKGKKLASIGALGMMDYPNWIKERGKKYADGRRKSYKARHESDRHKVGSAGYYADKLLW
jgi:hypothetical protein